jgi:hypothetical protein
MAIRMLKGVRTSFGAFEGGDIISGLSPVLESALVSGGDAIVLADDKGGELARLRNLPGGGYALELGDDGILALSELWPAATIINYSAASQNARSGACEYGGFIVRAITGTVNVQAFDALTATGTPLRTDNAVQLGAYPVYGPGMNARRGNTIGLSYIMTGGGTISLEPMVI